MQALLNIATAPGVTALLGVVVGIGLKGLFDVLGDSRRLKYEAREREEQRTHEAMMQQEEVRDRRIRAYAKFLGMAHTVGHQVRHQEVVPTGEDLRALAESYAEADVVARGDIVRREALEIFHSALNGNEDIIDTDAFVNAIRREEAKEDESSKEEQ